MGVREGVAVEGAVEVTQNFGFLRGERVLLE